MNTKTQKGVPVWLKVVGGVISLWLITIPMLPGTPSIARGAPDDPASIKAPTIANPHGKLDVSCEACHTAESWSKLRSPLDFKHGQTGFILQGRHHAAECRDCHESLLFSHIGTSCADCHRDVHQGRNGIRCQDCHTADRWRQRADAVRDHARTGFPLLGSHKLVECSRCHVGVGEAAITSISSECIACHAVDYAATRNPDHAAAGYSSSCESCHSVSSARWTSSAFNHASTGFPLTGAHRAIDCESCHAGGNYSAVAADCFSCHEPQYTATHNPNHADAGFPVHCSACHSSTSWQGATFDHNATRFSLTGAHRAVDCASCHVGGIYSGTSSDCFACHDADYTAAANPNHVEASFPTQCSVCHTTTAWHGASFNHDSTNFPLKGSHRSVDCASCHVGGVYTGTSTDCFSCHQDSYESTNNPNHADAGFPVQCSACHTSTSWQGATFDHSTTRFSLNGAHRAVDCASCHVGGIYSGTSSDCFSCHQDSYDATNNPNHLAAGFPTDCKSCHGTNNWAPADFNHDSLYFRIYSGKHRNKWNECSICHENPSNFSGFTCLQCHEHNRTKMDDKHRNRSRYQYESNACLECHRRV